MHRHEIEFSHRPKYAIRIDFHFSLHFNTNRKSAPVMVNIGNTHTHTHDTTELEEIVKTCKILLSYAPNRNGKRNLYFLYFCARCFKQFSFALNSPAHVNFSCETVQNK